MRGKASAAVSSSCQRGFVPATNTSRSTALFYSHSAPSKNLIRCTCVLDTGLHKNKYVLGFIIYRRFIISTCTLKSDRIASEHLCTFFIHILQLQLLRVIQSPKPATLALVHVPVSCFRYGSHRYRDFDEVLSVLSVVPDG